MNLLLATLSLIKSLTVYLTKLCIKLVVVFALCVGAVTAVDHVYFNLQMSKLEKALDVNPYTNHRPDYINPFLPNTTWDHIKPCGLYFDEIEEFNKANSCASEKVWPNDRLTNVGLPACYVITNQSPDILRVGLVNVAVYRVGNIALGAILGFYNTGTQQIFLTENIDIKEIYRHEVQHHLLQIHPRQHEIGNHDHDIFQKCESRTYTRSKAVQEIERLLDINR